MDNKTNKYIAATYKLYVDGDNGKELIEEATAERPFSFITGFGFALDKFEEQMLATPKGQAFNITLSKEDGYGEYMDEYVLDLDRETFCINGHFDHEHIYKDAIVPLQNEQGDRFNGRQEIDHLIKHMTGGCGGHCDSCGGGCDHDDCGCDHDHEHHEGCGCGHCH